MGEYFPDLREYVEFREPFLGGGSVAIHVSKLYPHLKITVNDLYEPLINFWMNLQMFGDELSTNLKNLKIAHPNQDSARCLFAEMKDVINDSTQTNLDRAVAFYVVNKCSFSGLTESSSFSAQASDSNFSMRGIEKLPEYSEIISHWHINSYSYEYCFRTDIHDGLFMYLDPPYDIKDNLYGKSGAMHKSFDHDKFAADCDEHNNINMLISYNSDQLVKDRFKNWSASEFKLTYTMRSVGEYMREQQERKELLLFNYKLGGLLDG
ncbi:DNA adenine methylase [Prochlorococcus phage P-SSM2]|uniref:site-specific DNA-methyltransferase (adenine-specific) n=1 Tax=Prochlorococcus phage P-SSM2 TaxID=268746 RepID=Q58MI9_BPPRM|nr:DNA methyltransferase [Prochlorococcus phage P-SSM2]AAX44543.1 DNA adenine methylase [Prochlorococcus phage P-SSM2]ACY76044.1 cytosine-specific methyl transferase [Prochlorococcus phage P-SSM2]